MSEVGFERNFYLRNVSKRLDQAVRPLKGARDNAIHAHMARVRTRVAEESVALAELGHAIRMALAWTGHARVLVARFFGGSKAPAEGAKHSRHDVSLLYRCDVCAGEWVKGKGVHPGDKCPTCNEGTVDLPIPF